MSFVMPAGRTRADVPEPTDEPVRIEEVPAREVAVIPFSGHAHGDDVEAVAARLLEDLRKTGVAARGAPFLVRCDAPTTPGGPQEERDRDRRGAVASHPSVSFQRMGKGVSIPQGD